jgi:hypothetical protein
MEWITICDHEQSAFNQLSSNFRDPTAPSPLQQLRGRDVGELSIGVTPRPSALDSSDDDDKPFTRQRGYLLSVIQAHLNLETNLLNPSRLHEDDFVVDDKYRDINGLNDGVLFGIDNDDVSGCYSRKAHSCVLHDLGVIAEFTGSLKKVKDGEFQPP